EGARACRRPPAVHAQQPRRSARTSYCGARPVLQTTVARRPSPGDPSMPVPSRDSLRDDLRRLIASRTGPLVVAHRGNPLGSFPDNTVRAAIGALRSGADVIETDVVRSADGEYFLFHTGYERKLLDADVDVRAMSARELDDAVFRWQGGRSAPGVERLDALLDALPDTWVNIDRSWGLWPDLLDHLAECDAARRVLLKSPPR